MINWVVKSAVLFLQKPTTLKKDYYLTFTIIAKSLVDYAMGTPHSAINNLEWTPFPSSSLLEMAWLKAIVFSTNENFWMDDLGWNISTESSFSMFEILNASVYFPYGREECWNTEFLIDHGGVQHIYSVPNLKHDMHPKSFKMAD